MNKIFRMAAKAAVDAAGVYVAGQVAKNAPKVLEAAAEKAPEVLDNAKKLGSSIKNKFKPQ